MSYRSYKNPLNKAPLRTVTGRGNDPRYEIHRATQEHIGASGLGEKRLKLKDFEFGA